MTAIKWGQIICGFLLILLPPAIHYRNWKHADRRTTIHRWFTQTLLGLWILGGVSWIALSSIDTVRNLKQQKQQWEWTTGGTNLPLLVCTALNSNRFSFEELIAFRK